MTHRTEPDLLLPKEVQELARLLRSIHFECRPSLGPEVVGRARRAIEPPRPRRDGVRRTLAALAIAVPLALTGLLGLGWRRLHTLTQPRLVDQCCFDLDGGGVADDGVLVLAGDHESIRHLTIYEDVDGSHSFTPGDRIRFSRGATDVLQPPNAPELSAFHQCCLDYDGGGKPDDGVLVLTVPPSHIVMASIYDIKEGDASDHDGALRPALH